MQLSEVFAALGEENFQQLLRSVSMGKLRTYRIFDQVKARLHMVKLNTETLRKAAPRIWARLQKEGSPELASDLAQAILVSHLDLIVAVLDFLEVPHEGGFFAKDLDVARYFPDGWQQRVYDRFSSDRPRAVLLFYINHLTWEMTKEAGIFLPAETVPSS